MEKQAITPFSRKETGGYFLVALLTLAIPLALFNWRALDNNSLTAWRWVFADLDAGRIFLYLLPVVVLAFLVSRLSFYEKPIWLVVLSFTAAAIFWPEPEAIMDAARYFTQAKHLEIHGPGFFLKEWGHEIFAWTDLPLVPFLYGLIFKYLGEARLFIQIFNTLLFSGTVLLTYLTGRLLWNEQIGFYAGLLLLGIPYLLTQVPLMLVDVPAMFFLMLCIFTFCKALAQGGTKRIVAAALALFMLFFAKYSTWLMLTVLPVIFIFYLYKAFQDQQTTNHKSQIKNRRSPISKAMGKKGREQQGAEGRLRPGAVVRRSGAVAVLALFFIGIVLIFHYDIVLEQIKLLVDYQKPGLERWGESFSSTFLFQIHPLITAAALFSLFAALRKKDFSYAVISYLLLLLVIVMQVKRIRYILPLFPLLTLMASYGLNEIKNRQIKKYIICCCLGSSLVLAVFAYLPFLQRLSAVNLQEAGRFLNALEVDYVEVFALRTPKQPAHPAVAVQVLDLFTAKPIVYTDDITPEERLKHATSSLRFTWEQKNPVYYSIDQETLGKRKAFAVISSLPAQRLPAEVQAQTGAFRFSKKFTTATNLFQYRTLVTVYYD